MTTTKRPAARKTAAKKKSPATTKTAAPKPPSASDALETKDATAATKRTALARRSQPLTLVTGGTGFLGSHLVRRLAEEGDAARVRVFATSAPAWLSELGVEVVRGSVTSASDVARAVEGVSEIYHLAGRVSREPEDAHQMYALHVDGTRLLCDAAREAGVRSLVLASTSGTVAVTNDPDITPDEDWEPPVELISRWPYYASKLYQERVALEHFAGDGRRLVIVNPSLLLGPGDERLSSTKVVLDFLARKIPTVPKGGLSFVDARDAADAFRAAMDCGRHGERYLLGAANWTFAHFFARLERLTKVAAPRLSLPTRLATGGARAVHALYRQWKLAPPVEPAEIDMAEHFWYLDASKAARELGFSPRDPAETLHATVTYVRRNFLGGDAFS
ncbi:MAG TPA: NAD-dependent epimerase/dehydratase family protein [Pyrinomonadaceae bacterium]|nr:NAD-dependent epimerase/dehydratase family protein [Pyrinomonadaceae bacterium]